MKLRYWKSILIMFVARRIGIPIDVHSSYFMKLNGAVKNTSRSAG